jgi:hypothetical protein
MTRPMRFLIDGDLLAELLLNRKEILSPSRKEEFFRILESPETEVYMLAKDFDNVCEIISSLADSKTAIEKVSLLKGFIKTVESECKHIWARVRQLPCLDLDVSRLVGCAEVEDIDAIVTHRPEKFSGVETHVSIWTFEMLHIRTRFEKMLAGKESIAKLTPEFTLQNENAQLISSSSVISIHIQFQQTKLANEIEQDGTLLDRSSLAEGWTEIKILEEEATSLFYFEDYKGAQLKYVQILSRDPSLIYIMVRILDCYRKQLIKNYSEQFFDDVQRFGNYILSVCTDIHHRKRVHQFLASACAKHAKSTADKNFVEHTISHWNEALLLSSDQKSNSSLDVVSNWNCIEFLLTFRRGNLYPDSELLRSEPSLRDRYLNRAKTMLSRLKNYIRRSFEDPLSVFSEYRQNLTEDAKKHFRGFDDSFWERILEEADDDWLWKLLIDK